MSAINKLESIDSGSNYKFGSKLDISHQPRSLFDLSHLNTLTIPNGGLMIPIDWFETLPNDDFDISVDCLLRVLPQVVPLYSRQRLYIYAFYSRNYDLWSGWDVFAKKGYSGNVLKQIPTLSTSNTIGSGTVQPDSLADYTDLPVGASVSALQSAGISALPYMMYLRIWRDFFCNKNYFIENRVILPDDDSRFRLDDDGQLLSAKDENVAFKFDLFGSWNDILYNDTNGLVVGGFYHDYPSDRFTSALPFTQRGDTPVMPLNASLEGQTLDFSDIIVNGYTSSGNHSGILAVDNGKLGVLGKANLGHSNNALIFGNSNLANGFSIVGAGSVGNDLSYNFNNLGVSDSLPGRLQQQSTMPLNDVFSGVKLSSGSLVGLDITVEKFRKLLVEQSELEKMARTDGTYAQFGLSFFGEVSKSARDYKPTYIGGTYKNISFTEVLQTSGSQIGTTDPSQSSPLGAYAGHGITGLSGQRIGHLHSDDFGMVMILTCIMPDIYYSQGIDKKFTKINQSELYLPERAKLGLQPILNKELYYAGNNGSSQGQDNYLWAYNNPFDEFRYAPNKIHGKIADSTNLSFFPYTQSRKFTSLPNWGREFTEANDIRKDFLASSTEDAYTAQFAINIRAVRPLPYKPIPAKII